MSMYAKEIKDSKSAKVERDNARLSSLPWWTWVLPFFIANIGTWVSLWFKTDPGVSLWYLPTALGIVMVYWWGPRALLGLYLNAVVSAPLWDLPGKWALLYALPETIEVGLSWFLFVRLIRGRFWLPDLVNVVQFLIFGSLLPAIAANLYLVTQLSLLGDILRSTRWENWLILFSADLATHFVLAVPALMLFTKFMSAKGWTIRNSEITSPLFLPENRRSRIDLIFIGAVIVSILILALLAPIEQVWIIHGLLMIVLAIRYGVTAAVLGSSWTGLLVFLLPPILKNTLGSSTSTYSDFFLINLEILFLSAVSLLTGRAISDLFNQISERKQIERALQESEDRYRTLGEQASDGIFISDSDEHYVDVNFAGCEMLGYSREEILRMSISEVVIQEEALRIAPEVERLLRGDPVISEWRFRRKDGSIFYGEVNARVLSDSRLLGVVRDITERKKADEILRRQNEYLALLNDMTHTILLSNNFDSTLSILAVNMAKLIDADDCYITRWDEEKQLTIPTATTAKLETPYSTQTNTDNELTLTASVLKSGQALAVDDVFNSPYISVEVAKRYPTRSVLGVPLIAAEHKLGAAIIAFNTPHQFTLEEIQRAQHAANQIALALWNFQQSTEIQHSLKESNALAEISRALSETERTGTDKVLQLIVDSARELISKAEESVIHLLEVEEQALLARAVSGYSEHDKEFKRVKMRLGEGVAGQVIREGITINIGDIKTDPRFLLPSSIPNFRSLLVAPIQSGGQQIGTISVQSKIPNAFSIKDAELLNSLGIQAALVIENTHLFETTQQRLKEVDALYKTSQGLAASLDADELIEDVITLLHQNFGYYHVQIYLRDPSNSDLILKRGSGEIGIQLLKSRFRLARGLGIAGHVAETAVPFVTNNVNDVVFFYRNPLLPNTQSELSVPIKVEGKVVGVLDIQHTPPNRLTEGDLQLMTAVADQLAVALQKANLYTDLQTALNQEQSTRSQLIQSERLALVGRLLASVSHELNNPLQAIQNALFLLKEENLSNQASQDLDIILSEAERMAALIERLRGAYRPVRIKDFRPVELNSLIEDVHALISTHMRQKEIAFEFVPDPDLPNVSGLSDQIRQVILNLFFNAIEVMKPGGRLTVQTRGMIQQNEVFLSVKDTGPGIDAEILPKIFDPFITSKHTGTGLGLTITHDIIEQHHGRIKAENDPEGGATFNVWLPMHEKG
jgi:PAS domain S-box-containing protein